MSAQIFLTFTAFLTTLSAADWIDDLSVESSGPLSPEQVTQFKEDGFLLVDDFLSMDVIEGLRHDVNERLDSLADMLYSAGKINSTFEGYDFHERLLKMSEEYDDAALLCFKQGYLSENFKQLYQNPKLLDLVQQLGIGSNVAAHPAWNLRCTAPKKFSPEGEVTYHQDNSYWEPRLWDRPLLSVWMPLVDVTAQNGALEFLRGSHKSGKTVRHECCETWNFEIKEKDLKSLVGDMNVTEAKTVLPAKPGSLIIFPSSTAHRSLPNLSNGVRWSIDLRFHEAEKDMDWFYGIKDSLLVRTADPNYKPDWTNWVGEPGKIASDMAVEGEDDSAAQLDPTIVGPWMKNWDITKINRHTDAFLKQNAGESLTNIPKTE